MTTFETITGLTLLLVGLGASGKFFYQIECYHSLSVKALELRLAPLEHSSQLMSYSPKCSGKLTRSENSVYIYSASTRFKITIPVVGKL